MWLFAAAASLLALGHSHSSHELLDNWQRTSARSGKDAAPMRSLRHLNGIGCADCGHEGAVDAVGKSIREASRDSSRPPPGLRKLQQSVTSEELVAVVTAQQLVDAVSSGVRHIQVRSHLDLTTAVPESGLNNQTLLEFPDVGRDDEPAVWSIHVCFCSVLCRSEVYPGPEYQGRCILDSTVHVQGNCTDEPSPIPLGISGALLEQRQPGQCVLVTDINLFKLSQELWLHNLYIRHKSTPRASPDHRVLHCDDPKCELWMTSMTLQGDNGGQLGGVVSVEGGQIYSEGTSITDFTTSSTLFISNGATVSLVRNSIQSNVIPDALANATVPNSVIVVAASIKSAAKQNSLLTLEQCSLLGNTATHTLVAHKDEDTYKVADAAIYSDQTQAVTTTGTSEVLQTMPLDQYPPTRPALDAQSFWFLMTQEDYAETAGLPSGTTFGGDAAPPTNRAVNPLDTTSTTDPSTDGAPEVQEDSEIDLMSQIAPETAPGQDGALQDETLSGDALNSSSSSSMNDTQQAETTSGGGGGMDLGAGAIVGIVIASTLVCCIVVSVGFKCCECCGGRPQPPGKTMNLAGMTAPLTGTLPRVSTGECLVPGNDRSVEVLGPLPPGSAMERKRREQQRSSRQHNSHHSSLYSSHHSSSSNGKKHVSHSGAAKHSQHSNNHSDHGAPNKHSSRGKDASMHSHHNRSLQEEFITTDSKSSSYVNDSSHDLLFGSHHKASHAAHAVHGTHAAHAAHQHPSGVPSPQKPSARSHARNGEGAYGNHANNGMHRNVGSDSPSRRDEGKGGMGVSVHSASPRGRAPARSSSPMHRSSTGHGGGEYMGRERGRHNDGEDDTGGAQHKGGNEGGAHGLEEGGHMRDHQRGCGSGSGGGYQDAAGKYRGGYEGGGQVPREGVQRRDSQAGEGGGVHQDDYLSVGYGGRGLDGRPRDYSGGGQGRGDGYGGGGGGHRSGGGGPQHGAYDGHMHRDVYMHGGNASQEEDIRGRVRDRSPLADPKYHRATSYRSSSRSNRAHLSPRYAPLSPRHAQHAATRQQYSASHHSNRTSREPSAGQGYVDGSMHGRYRSGGGSGGGGHPSRHSSRADGNVFVPTD